MSNENALWEDMRKLNDLYEELLWHPDDLLQFTHDGERIIIINTTLENKMKFGFTPEAEVLNARVAMIGFVAAVGAYLTTGQIIPWSLVMLLLATCMLGGFIFASILRDVDDDDDFGGGMLVPATDTAS